MFTGIIQETGTVQGIRVGRQSVELRVRGLGAETDLKLGDSVAVNGCCLTAVRISGKGNRRLLQFDLLRETWDLTNLQHVRTDSLVNLERPLRFGGTLDGHFVTGHIDGMGRIVRWERTGADFVLEITAGSDLLRYVVHKGSIAIDGISLTVAAVAARSFRVWIIPHTYAVTALRERKVGDAVNLETDILGKYVERFMGAKKGKVRPAVA